jgi:hypothetical protein
LVWGISRRGEELNRPLAAAHQQAWTGFVWSQSWVSLGGNEVSFTQIWAASNWGLLMKFSPCWFCCNFSTASRLGIIVFVA